MSISKKNKKKVLKSALFFVEKSEKYRESIFLTRNNIPKKIRNFCSWKQIPEEFFFPEKLTAEDFSRNKVSRNKSSSETFAQNSLPLTSILRSEWGHQLRRYQPGRYWRPAFWLVAYWLAGWLDCVLRYRPLTVWSSIARYECTTLQKLIVASGGTESATPLS